MGVPADQVYDPKTNPKGARCTYQDNMVNVFGRDPKTGFARRPFDNVGIQYGLKALNDGKITIEQFIDLNSRVGGHDIDGNVVAARTVADPEALRIAFQSGRVNDASKGMAMVPIIDVRPYTDGTGDVHDAVNSHITRARLIAANGTSGNQVLHTYGPGIFMDRVQPANLDEMEQWLAAIAKDTAPAKSPLEKVIRNRPATVTDACYTKDGQKITDMQRCAQMFPVYANPRLNAGLPMGATMLKCELKAVDRKDYSREADRCAARRDQGGVPVGRVRLHEEGRRRARARHLAARDGPQAKCQSMRQSSLVNRQFLIHTMRSIRPALAALVLLTSVTAALSALAQPLTARTSIGPAPAAGPRSSSSTAGRATSRPGRVRSPHSV